MRFTVGIAAAVLVSLLAGCSLGLHSATPQVQTYVLQALTAPAPGTAANSESPQGSASIQVSRPQAAPGLDTERIAILTTDHKGDYYAGAQWAGALPDVAESLVIDRLRSSGQWAVVQSSRSAFPAEYLLQLRIRKFAAEYVDQTSPPNVVVTIDCTLGRRTDREVLSSFAVTGTAMAEANRLGAVVAAFETAANAALDQLDERLSGTTQKVPRPVDSSKR